MRKYLDKPLIEIVGLDVLIPGLEGFDHSGQDMMHTLTSQSTDAQTGGASHVCQALLQRSLQLGFYLTTKRT